MFSIKRKLTTRQSRATASYPSWPLILGVAFVILLLSFVG
jgi:hypothetical protein